MNENTFWIIVSIVIVILSVLSFIFSKNDDLINSLAEDEASTLLGRKLTKEEKESLYGKKPKIIRKKESKIRR